MIQKNNLIKSDLIHIIADDLGYLSLKDVEDSVHCLLEQMTEALQNGERIEIRGFGTFSLSHRAAKIGRNPKTGENVPVPEKYVPRFKPGKTLSQKVNTV